MKRVLCETVSAEYDGKTADVYLRYKMNISGSLIKKIKRTENGLTVNGAPVYTNHRLSQGDLMSVVVNSGDERSENIPPCDGELDIVYEDEDILVVNKPSDLPVHPSIGHYERSLGGIVMNYYQKQGSNFVFRCVNRLDKGTTGLMVIAKHAHAHELLKQQLHTDDFRREYTALVCGAVIEPGRVEAPIARESESIIKRCVSADGDYALTEYYPLGVYGENSLVRLILKTGRTHQIRVHMAYIGHPLYGDFLYGTEREDIRRPALHSSEIQLIQPVTGQKLIFRLNLPQDIKSKLIN